MNLENRVQTLPRAETGTTARLDAVIDRWVGSGRIVGAVLMLARDGELCYRRAAGWADREAGVPVREGTTFRLASMTKIIVSAAALALVARGRLSLDDLVTDWLPDFTPSLPDGGPARITVRHLMMHTAGLSYDFLEPGDDRNARAGVDQGLDRSTLTMAENMRRLATVPLVHAPGAAWRYSVATDVLGAVIEQAAGMPLPRAVARLVTGPLGMAATTFGAANPSRLAAAYRDSRDEADPRAVRLSAAGDILAVGSGVPASPGRALDPAAMPSGGAGMCGTATDYLRFLEAIRTGCAPILPPELAAAMVTHAIESLRAWTEGEGWGFGLGVAVLLDPAAAASPQSSGTWQWGGVLGSHCFVDPAERLTLVAMTNTGVAGVIGAFPEELRDAIYAPGGPSGR